MRTRTTIIIRNEIALLPTAIDAHVDESVNGQTYFVFRMVLVLVCCFEVKIPIHLFTQ